MKYNLFVINSKFSNCLIIKSAYRKNPKSVNYMLSAATDDHTTIIIRNSNCSICW